MLWRDSGARGVLQWCEKYLWSSARGILWCCGEAVVREVFAVVWEVAILQ